MKRWSMGLAASLLFIPQIQASHAGSLMGGFGGMAMVGSNPSVGGGTTGGVGGGMVGSNPSFSGGAPAGFSGGMFGMCGHIGFTGMSGCCGGFFPYGHNFGCPTTFGGCFGGFAGLPTHTYSRWSPSPGKAYFFRHLHVTNAYSGDFMVELVLVHYPDRPKHFYYFDPAAKVYVGRYVVGAKGDACFSLLSPSERKADLKSIRESSFRAAAAMPTLAHLILPKTPALTSAINTQTVPLTRPPDVIPDTLLGLPPEEELGKKSK